MDDTDIQFMTRAIELARRGRGRVEPNPLVGAIVVKDGRIVGEGWHEAFGGPHAEVNALDAAGDEAREATLYVTLEPCCHQGKTPPCTDRVIASGIRRVVVAMPDPFPLVAGKGMELLRQAGIDVVGFCLEDQARALNAPYLTLIEKGRPFVHAKWAMSLDGRIATATGDSKWITGPIAREHGHFFRAQVDAILVGMGTVIADNPMLTPRLPEGQSPDRIPTRIILDSSAHLRRDSLIVRTAREFRTIVACTNLARPADLSRLSAEGCECIVFRPTKEGRVPLRELLEVLGSRRMTHLLVEGGGETIGSFIDAKLVDALRVYIAPLVIGGVGARPAVAGIGSATLLESLPFEFAPPIALGPDLFVEGTRPISARSGPSTSRSHADESPSSVLRSSG
jgi:diaminohydroxyphosphoribosylaminopyrimidine deaminase/5-amino-6-(5-phosphoribosylamino)uracil reductase